VLDAAEAAEYDRVDELSYLLRRQDGVISRRQALGLITTSALRHRLRSGRWRRAHFGVYLAQTGPVTRAQQRWIAVLACEGILAGLSALEIHGLRGRLCPRIDLLLPAGRHETDPPRGVVVHRSAVL
jgi:hypothetical protein